MMACDGFSSIDRCYKEMTITVPWGIIAAKAWGRTDGIPVLGLHGFLDNANTFDRIACLLPEDIYFIALDFPGHGKSSHRWPGMPYLHFEYIADVKKVVSHLQWKKFSIIGHSMGAGVGAHYAGTFPSEVENLILLDFTGPSTYPVDKTAPVLAHYATSMANVKARTQYVYPNLESAAERRQLVPTFGTTLTREDAILLVRRGTRSTKNGLIFSHDPAIKHVCVPFFVPEESLLSIFSKIQCKVLALYGTDNKTELIENDKARERINVINKTAKMILLKRIKGGHYFHLENPSEVVQAIKMFLANNYCQSKHVTLKNKL
ncbi:serine hydrolase-like protein 2 [Acropora millepora]|uniref:serine hydrolase-like protein 2 n=1 Tax=Acropora millepora TaxID=45264 RepID=UPI001CF39233|nr:serine hydrolase-like protein 2 [Acropora millepora]